jgi:beta-mannanase
MGVNAVLLLLFSGGVLYFTVGNGFRSTQAEARSMQTPDPTESAKLAAKIPTKQQVMNPHGIYFGLSTPQAPWSDSEIDGISAKAGVRPDLLEYFVNWTEDFRAQAVVQAYRQGTVPAITWEPWSGLQNGTSQPAYALARIIDGKYDGYITRFASAVRDQKWPIVLRFGHEMNGDWYPWSESKSGNHRGEYVQAWRHVHDIFESVGASNVSWVWSPNEFEGWNGIPIAGLYPGDAYVDWTGMSGYNWGTGQQGSLWRSFAKTFTRTYPAIRAVAPGKPLMISEVGSSENGGSKADWITDTFSVQLPTRFPGVRAVIWWNRRDEEMDWPIETSAAAQVAFAAAIASPYYAPNRFAALTASPIPPP